MNAEEALALAQSDKIQEKVRKAREYSCSHILKEILDRIGWACESGKTHIIYDWSRLDEYELHAFDLLKSKNYKIRPVWFHLFSQVKISWKHALTKPANDVMKGLVGKATLWERMKEWFK